MLKTRAAKLWIHGTLVLATAATTMFAQPAGWNRAGSGDRHKERERHAGNHRSEAVIVRQYYSTRGLPPGLAKRRTLPPGLRRQLVVGGHLPPGLEKRLYAVPGDLAVILPDLPYYQRRFFLGVDLLVVDTRRDVVVRVVADVLR